MKESTQGSERAWHALSPEEVLTATASSWTDGLDPDEAARRLGADGPNALSADSGPTLLTLVLGQFKDPMVYLLAGAGAVSLLAGKTFDAVVIALIVVANIVIGTIQEYRAEAALDALRRLSSPQARVVRSGRVRLVDAVELVVGDVLVLETGDRVPADARLLAVTDLRVDESALTGESDPVEKVPDVLDEHTPLADRANMAYSSAPVVGGRGTAVVVATGMRTVVGRIADEVRTAGRQESPLQVRLARLSTRLGILAVIAAAVLFGLGVLRGEKIVDMLLFSVAAAVSAIPEGLPTAVSVSLALGVQRMAKRRAIVRRLAAVETLGSCTVVCTDKTGTLTRNEMTVARIWAGGSSFRVGGEGFSPVGEIEPDSPTVGAAEADLKTLLGVGCAANNAVLEQDDDGRWRVQGNPTDGALLAAALKGGTQGGGRCDGNRLDEIPFSSATKYMATLDRSLGATPDGTVRLSVKGAPDRLLGFCDRVLLDGGIVELDEERRALVRGVQEAYAGEALRVVAAAIKDVAPGTTRIDRADAEQGCVFVGLWGLMDPARPEAARAVAMARRAGIDVKMITGDHGATGLAIARSVGILGPEASASSAITGAELDALDDDALGARVRDLHVFARVEPRHKIRIVAALQRLGEVVAMTGDGVNDAPALKRADIGVAMGITGTEVSKEAADMVLADDDFATIVSAVEEGRVIYGNVQRVVVFLLTIAIGEVATIAASQALGWPLPVTAVMVLWINLVSASTLTIPLGVEPKHEDVLDSPPRSPAEGIIDRRAGRRIAIGATFTALCSLAVFGYFLATTTVLHAQTMTFTTLVALEWATAIGGRSWTTPWYRLGFLSNRALVGGLLAGLALQWFAVSSPAAERILGTEALGPAEWAVALAVGALGLAVWALLTWVDRRDSPREETT